MGLEMNSYGRKRGPQEILPWSFIETGIDPGFLWEEYQKGLKGETSPPCDKGCYRCGVCDRGIRLPESHPSEIRQSERTGEGRIRRKPIKKKVRLIFTKKGEMRFISHLELAHLFYRASKRADLALSYSEGFHPMPRIVFATALPVGMESLMEIVDLELEGGITPLEVRERLNQTLPSGIEITEAKEVLFASPPPSLRHRSVYWISLDHLISREEVVARIKKALEKKELLIHQDRKGKQRKVDVRPLIERMEVKEGESREGEFYHRGVELVLRRRMGRTAKPSEIIGAILGLEKEPLAQCKVIKLE